MGAACVLCVVAVALAAQGAENSKRPTAWFVGKRFDQQLEQKLDATWANIPLADALSSLSTSSHLAIVLDRRIDPSQKLTLTASSQPLEEVLQQLAGAEQIGISLWEPIVYFGPAKAASQLRTLAWLRHQDLATLPAPRRQALSAQRAWEWTELATPRDLLTKLASEARVKLEGLDLVPHDLWPARRLPSMAWVDRLTLVAIQFGLTFEIVADGQSVRLVPIPAKVTARRSYPAGHEAQQNLSLLAQRYPETAVRVEGDEIVVDGRIEDLETVARTIVAGGRKGPSKPAAGKQVYKLSVETPVGELLEQLGTRLDLEFQLDRPAIEQAGISLDKIVSVKVQDVSLDELIAATLRPAGLKGVRRGRVVTVTPGAPAKAK
jgi:hypothetical protein